MYDDMIWNEECEDMIVEEAITWYDRLTWNKNWNTSWRNRLAWTWYDFCHRIRMRLTPISRCIEYGKPDTIFGKPVGNHADCLPF